MTMSLPLLALFLAAFTFGTAEFVIAGVLPDVALGLGVSIPVAGYLVSGYAIGIAIGGPALAVLTKKMNRKLLVVLLGLGFTLGQVLCAIAPGFELLLLARLFVSVLHGAYFGVAFVLATSIVPPARRGFAMALILSGLTVSNVLGVPGGTAIGTMLGWRATFWAVGLLGLAATLVIATVLPARAGATASQGSFRHEFAALGRQQVFLGFTIAMLVMTGQYSLFTYIAPLLLTVTGVGSEAIPIILLLFGIGATIGVFIGGRLADLFQPWRIKILAYDPYVDESKFVHHNATPVDMETLLRESDVVTTHCNLTKETTNLIGAKELDQMKSSAILVNAARGPIVDVDALFDALDKDQITGAALDVLPEEPPNPQSPILGLGDKVLLSPHMVTANHGTGLGHAIPWVEDVVYAILKGEVPEHVVNEDALPKWLDRFGGKSLI